MNKLTNSRRAAVVAALVEGNSIRATMRMTGVAKNTIIKLLVRLGEACALYHDEHVRNVKAARVQCDEAWSFVGCKQKQEMRGGQGDGDAWTFAGIDADSKLVISYLVGLRDGGHATAFMEDLAGRLANRVQLTTDAYKPYPEAVSDAFGTVVDFAQLQKYYAVPHGNANERRYGPSQCIGTRKTARIGDPDPDYISTSYIERQNLTMRMSIRRMTRLTNAFSKKWENHAGAIALHFMYYNFCRIHQTLRITPAMAAGLSDHVWEISDLLALLDDEESN